MHRDDDMEDKPGLESPNENVAKDKTSWANYLATAPKASEEFMDDVEDLPMQERE